MAGDPFDTVDPKLTIYALANGMDLDKDTPGERRLEWYRDAHERGILIRARDDGTLSLTAAAWKTKDRDNRRTRTVTEAVDPESLGKGLSAALDPVVDAANEL